MTRHWIRYSKRELLWIEARSVMPRRDAHKLFCETFKRADVDLGNFKALCTRKGWSTGRTGCYAKGSTPANKGKACAPGKGGNHPNARRTQFRKGERTGRASRLYKPIGTERLSKDGYLERKIHDGMPFQSRWRAVHLIRWEALHGAVPGGMCLKCLDGDRANTDPANWEAISRGALGILGGRSRLPYDGAAAELKPAILTLAKLKVASRAKAKVAA